MGVRVTLGNLTLAPSFAAVPCQYLTNIIQDITLSLFTFLPASPLIRPSNFGERSI